MTIINKQPYFGQEDNGTSLCTVANRSIKNIKNSCEAKFPMLNLIVAYALFFTFNDQLKQYMFTLFSQGNTQVYLVHDAIPYTEG